VRWRAQARQTDIFHGTGWKVCADELAALLALPVRTQVQENKDDMTRQSSPCPDTPTGSPRSQPDGSERQDALIDAYWKAQDSWSAQCFCFTSAPETLRRDAHEAAREGFARLVELLGPIVRPWLNKEYWAAVRQAREEARASDARPTPLDEHQACGSATPDRVPYLLYDVPRDQTRIVFRQNDPSDLVDVDAQTKVAVEYRHDRDGIVSVTIPGRVVMRETRLTRRDMSGSPEARSAATTDVKGSKPTTWPCGCHFDGAYRFYQSPYCPQVHGAACATCGHPAHSMTCHQPQGEGVAPCLCDDTRKGQ
jgi:hypothetical protein